MINMYSYKVCLYDVFIEISNEEHNKPRKTNKKIKNSI